jgi:hypothetical protein
LQVGEWATKNYQIEPIAFFFDAGHENASDVAKTFLETKNAPENVSYRLGSLTFQHDNVLAPLQAADIAAYELWRWLDEHYLDKTRHGRFPLSEIIKIEWTIREFDKPILEEMLAHRRGAKPIPRVIHSEIPALRPGKIASPKDFKRLFTR